MERVVDNLPAISKVELLQSNHPLFDAFKQVSRPRTRFQLEKFVIGQHDTPEQQYKQLVLELNNLYYAYQVNSLLCKKSELEIAALRATGNPVDEIDAQIKELGLEQTYIVMLGAKSEFDDLLALWKESPIKYSADDLEALQPIYWDARLTRQAQLEAVGRNEVTFGNLDALRQIGKLDMTQLNASTEEKAQLK